jgi:hypothetical protein
MDADDLRDYEDQLPSIHPTSPEDLGPYARFLQSMPDYSTWPKRSSPGLLIRFRTPVRDLHLQAF